MGPAGTQGLQGLQGLQGIPGSQGIQGPVGTSNIQKTKIIEKCIDEQKLSEMIQNQYDKLNISNTKQISNIKIISYYFNSRNILTNRESYITQNGLTTDESSAEILINHDGILKNFSVSLKIETGIDSIRTFMIKKNGKNTDLVLKVTGNVLNVTNNMNSLQVKKFDTFSLFHKCVGSPKPCIVLASIDLE